MGQDRNAANEGDLLKHSLVADVVGRCAAWGNLTYAETHAGAGTYDASNQVENRSHIRALRTRLEAADLPSMNGAGGRYGGLLNSWWKEPLHVDLYPGSVLQVALQLKTGESATFRVTEACSEAHQRLAGVVKRFGIEPRLAGFQDHVEWLTQNENLVLVVDPFTYTQNIEALARGHIDLDTLILLLGKCSGKAACVFGFWCAVADGSGWAKKKAFDKALKRWASRHSASLRQFAFGRFSMAWLGIGRGIEVVDLIPSREEWEESWLGEIVKESVGMRFRPA